MLRSVLAEGARVSMIMGVGDIISQTLVDKRNIRELQWERTLRFSSLGMVLIGPSLRFWYNALDRLVDKKQSPLKRGLKKMCIDQICFAPGFTYIVTTAVLYVNGHTSNEIKERLRQDYLTIMKRNYMLWPAAQIINFSFVPMNYQVIFAQFVAVIWNTYLATVLND